MSYTADSLTFTVALASKAHSLAEQFRQQQTNPQKAKQVYLNTLAVYAVNYYLQCLGIDTDLAASDCWNSISQTLMDTADLEVKDCGKLECRWSLPNSKICQIPPEVWSERIGYVVVQLDDSLQEATLLGYSKTANNGQLPISQLRSLEDLLIHLDGIRQPEPSRIQVNLSQWFENLFEAGWRSLEAVLSPGQDNLAFSFRSSAQVGDISVKGAKLIDLGLQLERQSVALLVAIAPDAEQKVAISVQVHPVGGATYLPPDLKLSLRSESGTALQEVQSRSQDNYIQLKRFRGSLGERFEIQVAFRGASVTETFVI